MTPLMTHIINISIAGLVAISIYKYIRYKDWKNFTLQIFIIWICFGLIYYLFYSRGVITARRSENKDVYFVIVLYFFMVLGMLAQYLFTRFEKPKHKRIDMEFDIGLFIAPIFASPIIFIPLLAAVQNVNMDLENLTAVKSMVFFVAFENGFFWKEYFDNRRKTKLED